MSWVIIVTERNVWPPQHGCDARICRLAAGIQSLGYKVLLLGSTHSRIQQAEGHVGDAVSAINAPLWDWAAAKGGLDHFDAGWYSGAIHDICCRSDVSAVIAEYLWMAPALNIVPDGILKVVDTHDVMHKRAAIYDAHGVNPWIRVSREREAELLSIADAVLAIQDEEASELRVMLPTKRVLTVGHWVGDMTAKVSPGNHRISIVGSDNHSNIYAVGEFLKIWNQVKDAELHLWGTVCGHVPDIHGVIKHGFVDDLLEAYEIADVVVNPTVVGTGLKIKTVEAMCSGKCVITTFCGAEGIYGGVYGCELQQMPRAIEMLLNNSDSRRQWERAAFAYAERHFAFEAVFGEFGKLIEGFPKDLPE